MAKVIQFLLLGLLIVHISESTATTTSGTKSNWKSLLKTDMSLSEFVDIAMEQSNESKLAKMKYVKLFNTVDKNGDLEIDSYELLTMN